MRDGGTKGKPLLCNGPGGGWQKTVCDPGGQSAYKKSRRQNSGSPEYFFQGERTERSGNFSGVRLVESSLECRKHFLRAGRRMILKIRGSGCSRMRMKKFVGMYHKSSIEGFDLLYERRGQNRAVGASEEYSLPLQLTQGLHSASAGAKQVALAHTAPTNMRNPKIYCVNRFCLHSVSAGISIGCSAPHIWRGPNSKVLSCKCERLFDLLTLAS